MFVDLGIVPHAPNCNIGDTKCYPGRLPTQSWLFRMHIINFSHPLTQSQVLEIGSTTKLQAESVRDVRVQFDLLIDFVPQVIEMLDGLGVSPDQWQTEAWLLVPPSLNFITAILLAELHGRMGRFPTIVRLRPVAGTLVSTFEVAEIINLDSVRNAARMRR